MRIKRPRFRKKCQQRNRSLQDVIVGVGTAQLSRTLPTDLKMLICTMATGYVKTCPGAPEAEYNKDGSQNPREQKCEEEKFYLEFAPKGEWTCEPCLELLRKINPEAWRERTGLEFVYKNVKKPQQQRGVPRWCTKKKGPEAENLEPESSEDSEVEEWAQSTMEIKRKRKKWGRVKTNRQVVIPSPIESLRTLGERKINTMDRCPHLPGWSAGGTSNICCFCLEKRRIMQLNNRASRDVK